MASELPNVAPDRLAAERSFLVDAIVAEAEAVQRLAERIGTVDAAAWHAAIGLIERCRGHVVVSGMGKSGLVGAKISATLASLGQPSHVVHPSEAVHGDLGRIRPDDVALLLSFSGETEEVVTLASILKADGVARVGISAKPESSLARQCDVHLNLGDIVEACPRGLAPTASTTAMLAAGDALALAVARRRNFSADDFHKHHPGGMLGVGLKPVTEIMRFRVGVNLAVVPESATIGEATSTAGGVRRPGATVLVDPAGRLSGIFTDGDLRRVFLAGQLDPAGPIRHVMTRQPQHLTVEHLVRDAVRLVRERRLDEIPVVDAEGRPVGLIDVQDLIALRVVQD
ncbi:MAG: KpsF/GutQ family sugar-phosphate isomerase [Phycisphaerae bacterium]|jgi:arabinose-5-phosphate isomerase|nr:KpsF/GutQ family sugar-phosphate isomerase [Phycisphaerae bacterium]